MRKNYIIGMTIGIFLFLLPFKISAQDFSYFLEIQYTRAANVFSFVSIQLVQGAAPMYTSPPNEGFAARVIAEDSAELYRMWFTIPRFDASPPNKEWFDANTGEQIYFPKPEESEMLPIEEQVRISLVIPYFEKAKKIEILDPKDSVVLSIEIPQKEQLAKSLSLQYQKQESTKGEQQIQRQEEQQKEEKDIPSQQEESIVFPQEEVEQTILPPPIQGIQESQPGVLDQVSESAKKQSINQNVGLKEKLFAWSGIASIILSVAIGVGFLIRFFLRKK